MIIGHVDTDRQVLVVAEIGLNHEGNLDLAKKMVQQAAKCGVGAVKFQTYQTKFFISRGEKTVYDTFSSFELPYQAFEELHALAKSLGLLFMSTPLDLESARALEKWVDAYKIGSGENNHYPLLDSVCKTGKPIVLSSGLSDRELLVNSKRHIENRWKENGIRQQMAVLHCVSSYPTPPDQANLSVIPALAADLDCTVGYSDHTLGVEACMIAVAMGARIIEKHFTLDKNFSDFQDHRLSADPADMKVLVDRVKQIEVLRGSSEKRVQPGEMPVVRPSRRSIVAAADLPGGHLLTWQDMAWIRPGGGLPPGDEHRILGKRLKRDLSFGEPILPVDVA